MKKTYPKYIVTKDRKGNITEYKPDEKQIYSLCRSCGKKGIHAYEILDATETAYVLDEQSNERCYHCDSLFIDDWDWEIFKEYDLIEGKRIKKDLAKLFNTDEFEELKLNGFDVSTYSKKKYNKLIKLNNLNKELDIEVYKKPFRIMPSSSFIDGVSGVIIYILVILFCILVFGDYDISHGPRFFGDPDSN